MAFKHRAALSFAIVCLAVFSRGATGVRVEEQLAEHRNLGKAFYENPTTSAESVAEFKKALDLARDSNREKLNYGLALLKAGKADQAIPLLKDVQQREPKLPHTWFNLGIYYKKAGNTEQAIAQFRRMIALVPEEPIAHYQLGSLYKLTGQTKEAVAEFEKAEKLNPLLAAAHFQLYNMYRQDGRAEEATRELKIFQQLKQQNQNAAVPEDVDWCNYAEIYDPPVTPASPPAVQPVYEDKQLEGTVDAKTAGVILIDVTGKGDTDALAWSSAGAAIYRRGLEKMTDSGLNGITGVLDIAPGDFDNDGLMDICVLTESGPQLYRNAGGKFAKFDANLPQRRFERAVWIDYDHDYDLDLMLLGESSALMRNQGGAGFADRTADFPFANGHPVDAYKLRAVPDTKAFDLGVFYRDQAPVLYRDQLGGKYQTSPFEGKPRDRTEVQADFDADGRVDRFRIAPDGTLHFLQNQTPRNRRWIRVQLAGVKSLKLAQDAEVEIKAGQLYRKQTYEGVPLLFDVAEYAQVDVVRITWPNGLIQSETRQATNRAYKYEEAQRLSGSCPMIWTWNGREHQFITDVLGVAPLGASDGEGTYFPVDHDEYVSIPSAALKAVNGSYDIRITEELSEVSYLDQVQLLAVDHPADTEIFTNEKFKGPPYPEFRLFGVKHRRYPVSAHDEKDRDVLPLILQRDRRYPDQFRRTESGIAEIHNLELDFGFAAPSGRAVLLLQGWVDWPDGSTFRGAAQEHKDGLVFPRLEMQDAGGSWRTVSSDMGMPAGKPKTIAVELQFLSSSRKLRIVTNLCVYWDEIFLSEETDPPQQRLRPVPLVSADLNFRGFSEAKIDQDRKQPDTYSYARVLPASYWNPTPGFYTRYGNVRELLENVDDRLVIMGSGDETRLRFSADRLPPAPAGWTRDYLLKVDGWAKDRDPNTAFSSSVEPLPFHGMSVYPYPPNEHFPSDALHEIYRREYNTRPALRLIRPLAEDGSSEGN